VKQSRGKKRKKEKKKIGEEKEKKRKEGTEVLRLGTQDVTIINVADLLAARRNYRVSRGN